MTLKLWDHPKMSLKVIGREQETVHACISLSLENSLYLIQTQIKELVRESITHQLKALHS